MNGKNQVFLAMCPNQTVKYLDGTGKAKIIVTTGYWRHPADDALISFAAEKEYPCVELG